MRFEQKRVLIQVSDSQKNTSVMQTNFVDLRNKFPFFNEFQILYAGSSGIKELWKPMIFKNENDLNFLKKWVFFARSPSIFFQNLDLSSNFGEILNEKS